MLSMTRYNRLYHKIGLCAYLFADFGSSRDQPSSGPWSFGAARIEEARRQNPSSLGLEKDDKPRRKSMKY